MFHVFFQIFIFLIYFFIAAGFYRAYLSGKRRKKKNEATFAAIPPPIVKVGEDFKVSVEIVVLKGALAGAAFKLKGENNSADRNYTFRVNLAYLNGESIASKKYFVTDPAEPGEKVETREMISTSGFIWDSVKITKIDVDVGFNRGHASFDVGQVFARSLVVDLAGLGVEQTLLSGLRSR